MPISGNPQPAGDLIATAWPSLITGVAWVANPNTSPVPDVFTDMTTRVNRGGWTCTRGRQYELGRTVTGTAQYAMDNADSFLDPDNTGSPFAPNLLPYRRVQQWAWLPANKLGFNAQQASPVATYWTVIANGTLSRTTPHLDNAMSMFGLSTLPNVTSSAAGNVTVQTANTYRAPVTAAQTYTAGVSVTYPTGAATAPTAQAILAWYDNTGTLLSTTLGAAAALNDNGYLVPRQVVNVTGTAPAGAATAAVRITFSGATAAGAAFQFDAPSIALGSTTAVLYRLWGGFTNRFPQSWEDEQGRVDLDCVGAMGLAARIPLSGFLTQYLSTFTPGPQWLFPMTDAAGSVRLGPAGSIYPTAPALLTGGTGGQVALGSTATPIGAPEDTTCTFTPTAAGGSSGIGQKIWALGQESISLLNGYTGKWTLLCLIRTSATASAGTYQSLISFMNGSDTNYLTMGINSSNQIIARLNTSNRANLTVTSTGAANDGLWHVAAISHDGAGIIRAGLDGSWTNGAAGAAPSFTDLVAGQLAGRVTTVSANAFSGGMAYAALFLDDLYPTAAISNITNYAGAVGSTQPAYRGDTETQLVQDLAVIAGYTRSIAPGFKVDAPDYATGYDASPMQGLIKIKGKSVLGVWQEIADSAGADLCEYGDGLVHVQGRRYRQKQLKSRFTFGESTSLGEIPYDPSVQFDLDPTFIYNTVQVDQVNGITAIARDTASEKQYFTNKLDASTASLVQSSSEVVDQANYTLALFKDPHARLSRLVFRPSHLGTSTVPNAWKAALSLEIGDRVTVKRRPLGGGPVKSADYFVEHIQHDVFRPGPGEWATTLLLSPLVWSQVWNLAASHGTLSVGSAAGATGGVFTVLPDSATNPCEATLRPGQVLVLEPSVPALTETVALVTVQGAPTPRVAGYTSINVTWEKVTQSPSLVDAYGPTDTTINLFDATTATWLSINGEWMQVTGGSGTSTLTVKRGQRGTVAGSNPANSAYAYISNGTYPVNAHSTTAVWTEPLPITVTDPTVFDAASLLGTTTRLAW